MKPAFDKISGGGKTPAGSKQNSGKVQMARVAENVAGKDQSTSGMPSKK